MASGGDDTGWTWFAIADSGGFDMIGTAQRWRYRDYVIRAFNEDKPYDRFLREQIAGDETGRIQRKRASPPAYLRLGLENNLKNEQTRLDELDDLVVDDIERIPRCHRRLRAVP